MWYSSHSTLEFEVLRRESIGSLEVQFYQILKSKGYFDQTRMTNKKEIDQIGTTFICFSRGGYSIGLATIRLEHGHILR